ncbi:MAG TPA: NCS2 family permease [Candidatus Dormibacteraeota bacterium]|nr:NCS2 family permease [Candidatus Dormibacteraeota bacterium]
MIASNDPRPPKIIPEESSGLLPALARRFHFAENSTDLRREVAGGITTFLTMSYIVAVNPAILRAAGMPAGASMTATIAVAVFGTVIMGLYANRPFAIAPYMGENAFIAYTVVHVLGYSWQQALAAVFLGGLLFLALTVLRLRQWLVRAVPEGLRYSFAAGIGLFLSFIGLNECGIVALGTAGAPVKPGLISSGPVLLAVGGILLLAALMIRRFPGAILVGMLLTTALGMATGLVPLPRGWVSAPPSLAPLLFHLDFHGAFTWGFFPVVLTIFVMAFVDTMGTLIGVSARAGLLDERGELPQIERPMLADALSTVMAPLVGTTTAGAFIESATGIEAGARTGFAALVTAFCFVLTLFFAPLIAAIPRQAYGPALVIVGLLMLEPITRLPVDDLTESIPAFAVITLMSFTYNVGIGITAGLVLYPLCKVVAGRRREVAGGLWVLGLISLLFFVFYPYR